RHSGNVHQTEQVMVPIFPGKVRRTPPFENPGLEKTFHNVTPEVDGAAPTLCANKSLGVLVSVVMRLDECRSARGHSSIAPSKGCRSSLSWARSSSQLSVGAFTSKDRRYRHPNRPKQAWVTRVNDT